MSNFMLIFWGQVGGMLGVFWARLGLFGCFLQSTFSVLGICVLWCVTFATEV